MATRVARDGFDDAINFFEIGFNAPETATGEDGRFDLVLLRDLLDVVR